VLLTALYRGHATLDDLVTDGKLSVKVQEALAANHKAVETEYYAFAIYALQKYPEYVTKVIKRQELLHTPERITGKGSTTVSSAATGGLAKKLDFSSAKKEPSAEETKPSTSSSNKAAVASDAVLTKRNVAPAPVPTETPASSSANSGFGVAKERQHDNVVFTAADVRIAGTGGSVGPLCVHLRKQDPCCAKVR